MVSGSQRKSPDLNPMKDKKDGAPTATIDIYDERISMREMKNIKA